MSKNPRFWRNVTLIAVAHIALIAELIRWSLAARSTPDEESLVWLSAGDLEPGRSDNSVASNSKTSIPSVEPEPLKPDEEKKEPPPLIQAKSEIELPNPTPMETAVPKATAKPKAPSQPTPKPTPKPTPRKTLLAKATKSSAHPKPSAPKATEDQPDASDEKKKSAKTVSAKIKLSADNGAGKTGSTGKGGGHVRHGTDSLGRTGGGTSASEFGWYGSMLHDRFYSAWIQPTSTVASGTKISTLVKVRIEKDGHVSKFEIIKPSENVVVNESVAAVAKRVTEVDPPPVGLGNGNHYDVKINFELNTSQETAK
jgi:outer membrane biosynthesis protein TonB